MPKKRETTKKAGEGKARKARQKQTSGATGKSKAAWISAVATICAAVIGGAFALVPKLRKEPATPLADPTTVDRPFWQEMEEPVAVWPKKEGSKYGYTQPPKIQIAGGCSERLERDALCVQCDKPTVREGSSSEEVEEEHMYLFSVS